MKILLSLLFSLCFAAGTAQAQSRFEPDSISIEYAQCKGDTAKANVLLINRGSNVEIVDLRFADSNRSWEIYDTNGSYASVKGAVLFAGDTLKLALRQRRQPVPSDDWYRDTLVTSGAATSDTLLLNARILTADLKSDLTNTDLGIRLQNTIASYGFKIWNDGDAPHVFHYTVSPGWTLEGIAIGDTLMPGDTVDVLLVLVSTASIGTYSTVVWIHGDCGSLVPSSVKVKIVPAHAYWTNATLVDSVKGCDEPRSFELSISNGSSFATRIDSIQFVGQGEPFWALGGDVVFPFQLASGAVKNLTLIRRSGATSTRLVIHSDKPGEDTLPVTITSFITKPRIRNHRDTVVLNVAPNDDLVYTIEVQNQGPGLYRLADYQLESSQHWSVLGFDSITTAGLSKSLQVKLVFAGSSSEGDFPATILIQGSECDTILRQTLIARVATLDVAAEEADQTIRVYPSVASTMITLRTITASSYAIYDVLGKGMLIGLTTGAETNVDVSMLPMGHYYIRVASANQVSTLPIVVKR